MMARFTPPVSPKSSALMMRRRTRRSLHDVFTRRFPLTSTKGEGSLRANFPFKPLGHGSRSIASTNQTASFDEENPVRNLFRFIVSIVVLAAVHLVAQTSISAPVPGPDAAQTSEVQQWQTKCDAKDL